MPYGLYQIFLDIYTESKKRKKIRKKDDSFLRIPLISELWGKWDI